MIVPPEADFGVLDRVSRHRSGFRGFRRRRRGLSGGQQRNRQFHKAVKVRRRRREIAFESRRRNR